MNSKLSKKTVTRLVLLLVILICLQYICTGIYIGTEIVDGASNKKFLSSVSAATDNITESMEDPNKGEYLRLSNVLTDESIPYRSESRVGYGRLRVNEIDDNHTKISIKVEGANYPFDYGIFAHANSEVYYNVAEYSEKYHTLTAYVGLNSTSNSGDGVKFWIYTSNKDTFYSSGPENWELQKEVDITPGKNAEFIKVDITGAKYLRLQAYQKSGNGSDHSVYVNPMLITDEYKEETNGVESVESYDKKIKAYPNKTLSDPQFELLLLQRELTKNTGNYALQRFLSEDPTNKDILDWLMNDVENLRPYILGGKPEGGSYLNSFKILKRLYDERGDDLKDTTVITTTRGEKTLGEMYKTMMLSISLTHCGNVYLWINGGNKSDPVERYDVYKRLYHGKVEADDRTTKGIGNDLIEKNKFASLHVEEMRWVMNTIIDNEEIEWLNWYAREVKNGAVGPYSYQAYTSGYNYNRDQYYSEANKEKWTTKYNLSTDKWNVTYGRKGNPKLWIVFEEGSVCGGLSKNGACVWGSFKGLPNTCVSQPGHCAYIYYNQDANGNGVWGLGNDVGGWHQTGRTEHLNVRMPLEWGNEEYIDVNKDWLGMGTYILFAQGALNQFENYKKSREILILADVYKDDLTALYKIYEESLKALPINIDAWYGLIKAYRTDDTKTDEDYYKLAEGIFEELKLYPLPMYHIAREVQKNLKTTQYQFKFTLDQTSALNYAKDHSNESIQASAVKLEATHLLGQIDSRLATFSFDGGNAGTIVLGSRFNGSDVAWDYSLDGKQTWTQAKAYEAGVHAEKLTKEQIESITSTNDIYVHIIGVPWTDENCYKIDITEQALLSTLYPNDLENRVVGVNLLTEWRYTENDDWTSYSKASPDLTGNKQVQVRQAATGTKLTSPASSFYTFTEDNQPDTRKYIPVSHLSKVAVSTEAVNNGGAATNALDANYNTRWHSAWNGTDTQRFFTVKLDKPVYLSAIEFVPAGGGNGRIVDGTIWGSIDGENWEVLTRKTGITYPKQANTNDEAKELTQSFEIDEPKEVQYVKIVADRTNGNWFTARAFNFYQDLTINPHPTASVSYSTTESTSEPVVARLVNPSTKITITNNGGNDTYIFTENGNFTFEFEDENGNTGTAEAKVNWIDKKAPTADVEYKINDDKKLIAILDNISEDVYLLDENNNKINYIEVNENKKVTNITYLDNEGNTYKVLDKDENGNTTKITYKNTTTKVPNVATYTTTLKTEADGNDEIKIGEVINEEYFDNEGNPVTVTDAEKEELRKLQQLARSNPLEYALETSGEYEFKMLDKANNLLYKSLKVDYIDNDTKILASDITYDITNTTNTDVVATIKPYIIDVNGNKDVNVEITNNNGKDEHTFTENGEFTFQYSEVKQNEEDTDKEVKEHTATVNWIDKKAPTAEISYSTQEETDKPVVAKLVNESEAITIINNGGSKQHTFTDNNEFTFEFLDKAGNKGTATAIVTWIKTADEQYEQLKAQYIKTITDYQTNVTDEELNNKKINSEEKNAVIDAYNKLKDEDKTPYTEFIDRIKKGGKPIVTVSTSAKLSYKEGENVDLYSLITIKDNEDGEIESNKNNVKITTDLDIEKSGTYDVTYEVIDQDGNKTTLKLQIVIEENTEPRFKIDLGTSKEILNPGDNFEIIVNVSNIKNVEKGLIAMTGKLEYDEDILEMENIIGEDKWNFDENSFNNKNFKFITENGQYVLSETTVFRINMKVKETVNLEKTIDTLFKIKEIEASNGKYLISANDSKISLHIGQEEQFKISSDKYNISDNMISYVLPNTTVTEFNNHITANRTIHVMDKENNEQTSDSIVKTGMKLKVDNEDIEYTIVVLGDINEDGKMDVVDLAKIKLHLIEKDKLTGINLLAADLDKDGELTINDAAIMKLILIDLISFK